MLITHNMDPIDVRRISQPLLSKGLLSDDVPAVDVFDLDHFRARIGQLFQANMTFDIEPLLSLMSPGLS